MAPPIGVQNTIQCKEFLAQLNDCHIEGGFFGKFSDRCGLIKLELEKCLRLEYEERRALNAQSSKERMVRYQQNQAYYEKMNQRGAGNAKDKHNDSDEQ